MPIVRINGKLIYFAHVPKCAGTAIMHYLNTEFGPLAFQDSRYHQIKGKPWTITSPQHVTAESLARLFPEGFFDEIFSIVRHPVARMISVYRFQRDVEKHIPADTSFSDWLSKLKPLRPAYDNHTLPMDAIVPRGARIYRLEDGLAPLVHWLQQLAGPRVTLPETILPRNALSARLAHQGQADNPVDTTAEDRQRIAKLYEVDFTRFGYTFEEEETA